MSKDRDRAEKFLEIRRYSNRRFYDTTHSRHVTMDEIHDRVKQGWRVRVTDASSGEDITARVLTQLILELDVAKLALFPPELLHRIIQAKESLMGDFMDTYFNRALELFLNSRQQFDEQVRQNMGFATPPGMPGDWLRNPWGGNPFNWNNPATEAPGPEEPPPPAAQRGPDLQSKMDDLNREMESLREELSQLRKPGPKRPAARKKRAK